MALSWSSTNNNIVTVDQEGNVTALLNGDAQIMVKADDGSAEATCNIHIRNMEDFISVGYDSDFPQSVVERLKILHYL